MKRTSPYRWLALWAGLLLLAPGCKQPAPETHIDDQPAPTFERPRVPDWAKNAVIYEVNLRQYTPEGTIAAFRHHLPRLRDLGVDILWFMPIHPISQTKRKGTLGSYYAVADYKAVNPEHGTLEEFKALVQEIHDLGMKVILDWVPNHTGWDHPWISQHPDWYTQDENGNILDPVNPETGESWGWTDVADLNYDVPEMRLAMIEAMKFWVTECDVDGFRCDVAHGVPADFWVQATDSLYALEPLFMLAEAEVPELRNNGSFVMDYGWSFHHLMNEIARGEKNALDIERWLQEDRKKYTQGYHMHFTSNHDENSWAGTEFERLGEGHKAFAVLAATFDGMPLIYSGQEAAFNRRLAFFEKDSIDWGDFPYTDFYRTLFELKHRNQALWNGKDGGELQRIPTGADDKVFAFLREKNGDRLVVVINLSPDTQTITLQGSAYTGEYTNVFARGTTTLLEDMMMTLDGWEYAVFSNK